MSDSESECDWRASEEDSSKEIAFLDEHITIVNPKAPLMSPDDVFENWDKISERDKKESGQLMKICAFWMPILLQRDENSTVACWAAQIGLVEPYKDLNLKHIQKIEILEAVLRALVTGTLRKAQTKQVVWITNRFHLHSPEVLENALQWLERTGEPKIRQKVLDFGHLDLCFKALHLIFVEFSQYIKAMSLSYEGTMRALRIRPSEILIRRSEEMKRKGNEHFQNKQYEDAVKFYSKALKYNPDNHILYGNRAQCYINSNNFLKALGDGKRATLIKPFWAKGHYRYCEALFGLGEVCKALEANAFGKSLVQGDSEEIKDLENQHHKFTAKYSRASATSDFATNLKWSTSQSQMKESSPRPQSPKVKEKKAPPVKKEREPKVEKKSQPANNKMTKTRTSSPAQTPDIKPAKSVQQPLQKRPQKPAPVSAQKSVEEKTDVTTKPKEKTNNTQNGPKPLQKPPPKPAPESAQKCVEEKTDVTTKPKEKTNNTQNGPKKGTVDLSKELSAVVTDGHSALKNLRSRNAEQAFSRALALVGQEAKKVPGVTSIDVLLLHFGRASALTQIGRPEELAEAVLVLDQIQASEERTFQCLVCLAYGRIYVKENRFQTALPHFFDAQNIVKNQITPGILTWPLTSLVVPETQLDVLTEILDNSIELCKFPPLPDAICRIENCLSSVKKEIYFTDPDFKGFIQIHCCQSCNVEYHINCWKSLKTQVFYEKNEKDFLQDPCFTPDCKGQINSIKIYGPTGLVKCKFEVAIPRPVALKKVKVNQNCTSLKKIKSKEERALRRKQFKQTTGDPGASNTESTLEGEDSAATPRVRLHFRDHVLLQISQHVDLLRGERSACVSPLTSALMPWLQLDLSRGNDVAARLLQSLEEPSVTLGAAVELLLERRNRVWGRLLIQILSDCADLQPKVSSWAQRLDSAGLSAASFFMEQHSSELEQLDLSLLLSFSPVQDIILEKLGSRPELFSSMGLTVTEYLRQSPPRDARIFIWALEEHRHHYTSCHSLLDHYFDMMDGLCSVLKKSEENIINSPSKSKNRVKKKKAPKPVLVWNSPQAGPVADDWGPGLVEDDSLSFLDQPFTVPPHLRQQVASFEQQYYRNSSFVLDNQPEPSKDTLYDYFSQILAEHGPLSPDDPLLVGELMNFPPSLQRQIETSGGLESFLLSCPTFMLVGGCVALARIETQSGPAPQNSLDQLDTIDGSSSPLYHSPGFFNFIRETFPTLPNPYDFYTERGDAHQPLTMESNQTEVTGAPVRAAVPQQRQRDERLEMLSVAVNTEEIQDYEHYQGELTAVMKQHWDMQTRISSLPEDRVRLQQQRSQDLKVLEEELSSATSSVQVTQKELSLFQHKLEEEVKKDQKDKKEHQEKLKSLKQEMEALQQEKNRMKKTIKEKNSAYEARLRDFLELSNHSEAEKLSLEEELKRCKDVVNKASQRSLLAQVAVLESSREQSLYTLHRELADSRAVLHRLVDVAPRFAHQEIEAAQSRLRAAVKDIEKKISSTQAHYEQLIKDLRNGSQISDAQPGSEAQSLDTAPEQVPVPEASPRSPPPPPAGAAAAAQKKKKQRRAQEVSPPSMFERAVERLTAIFPHLSRSELTSLIQKLRSSSGSLHALSLQDVVGGVSQLILDQQEEQSRASVTSGSATHGPPPSGHSASAWQPLEPHKNAHPNALNLEDPCIICHEDMNEDDLCVLECRHSFHRECIRSWLKEQSTCPTCRDHTLLLEDFPTLSSQSARRH